MNGLHPWDVTPERGAEIQDELRGRLQLTWDGREVTVVAGVDVCYRERSAYAAVALFRYSDLRQVHAVCAAVPATFPYIPGLLAFREGPAVLSVWKKLELMPDLTIFDAHGVAHPRGLGLASHMGLWLDTPSIGVAKSRLYGLHDEPDPDRWSHSELHDERDPTLVIGAVLRTRSRVKPVYISPGHLIDVAASVRFVRHFCTRYRLPEPIRWAHRLAKAHDTQVPGWHAGLTLC